MPATKANRNKLFDPPSPRAEFGTSPFPFQQPVPPAASRVMMQQFSEPADAGTSPFPFQQPSQPPVQRTTRMPYQPPRILNTHMSSLPPSLTGPSLGGDAAFNIPSQREFDSQYPVTQPEQQQWMNGRNAGVLEPSNQPIAPLQTANNATLYKAQPPPLNLAGIARFQDVTDRTKSDHITSMTTSSYNSSSQPTDRSEHVKTPAAPLEENPVIQKLQQMAAEAKQEALDAKNGKYIFAYI